MRPRWRASFFVTLLCGATVAAAPPATPLDSYLLLVNQFASGDTDGADAALAIWKQGDEQDAVDGLIRDRPLPEHDADGAYRKQLEAASLLEFDLAFRSMQLAGPAAAAFRLGLSRSLMDALNTWPIETVAPFERHWYLAAATGFTETGELEPAWREVQDGLDRFPSDASLHLAAGIVAETAGASGVRTLAVQTRTPLRQYRMVYGSTIRKVRLPDPAAEYQKALALDATVVEARVRLGRVLTLKGDLPDATSVLSQATAMATDVDMRYLAHLFLARALANAGDVASADREYQAARETHPQWPTPYIGLSLLAARRGDASAAHGYIEAVETLERQRDLGAGGADDPWWSYWPGGRRDFDDTWQWLRQAVAP